jgi:hypothetical protein
MTTQMQHCRSLVRVAAEALLRSQRCAVAQAHHAAMTASRAVVIVRIAAASAVSAVAEEVAVVGAAALLAEAEGEEGQFRHCFAATLEAAVLKQRLHLHPLASSQAHRNRLYRSQTWHPVAMYAMTKSTGC